jgi:hypothetical protein
MDVDLDAALKQAAEETIAFLQREKGLSPRTRIRSPASPSTT